MIFIGFLKGERCFSINKNIVIVIELRFVLFLCVFLSDVLSAVFIYGFLALLPQVELEIYSSYELGYYGMQTEKPSIYL